MKNYVEMAKKEASSKKAEEAAKKEQEKKESANRERQVINAMKSLKRHLKQWGDEEGFAYKDCGEHQHVNCAEIWHKNERLLGFRCGWRSWETQWSDDCKGTCEGVAIEVTYYMEMVQEYTGRTVNKTMEYHYGDKIGNCMEDVARYLSKFF